MKNNSNLEKQQKKSCDCHLQINKLTRDLRTHISQSQINVQVIRNLEVDLNEANAKLADYENLITAMQQEQIKVEKLYLMERGP